MANYIATDAALIATASAIRSKRGITSPITFNASKGFADAISPIPAINFANVTATAADVFNNKYFYTSEGVRTQGTFPSGVVLPASDYTLIPIQCYMSNTSIRYVTFPNCTSIDDEAFLDCTSLTSVNFPACTTIGMAAFQNCTSLTSVNFPACTTIGMIAFRDCTSLTSVSFPACPTIEMYAFGFCSSLTSVSFPACSTIRMNAFRDCTSLSVICLAKNSVVTLMHANAFNQTGITSTTGSIRVPSSLVNSYKAATNWTYFSNRIFAI